MQLASFYFAHDEAFLIPVEHLSNAGMSDAFAAELASRALVPVGFRTFFDEVYRRTRERMGRLALRAPEFFPPLRTVNIVVLRDHSLHAFFQPFEGMCALVYAADFDQATSSLAHAEFQLVVGERVVQTRKLSRAILAAMPHLLAMNEEEAADFVRGAERSTRPDHPAAQAVGAQLHVLREVVTSEGLRDPAPPLEGFGRVKGTALVIPKSFAKPLNELANRVEKALEDVLAVRGQTQGVHRAGDDPRARVLRYLKQEKPQLLVAKGDGTIIWSPETGEETNRVEVALPAIGSRVADSLIADFRVADRATRLFHAAVHDATTLSVPGVLEEGGGVYLHHTERKLVYALEQPGVQPLEEAALPYYRLNLAARTMHEWGHVAATAGIIDVPANRKTEFQLALKGLAKAFADIVGSLTGDARKEANDELLKMREAGDRLEDLPFARLEDYRANLLVKHFMPREVLEAYVRTNVRSLLMENVAPLRKLARYAYEAQYLWLGGLDDPWDYFVRSTYFLEEYVESGFTTEALCRNLFEAMRALCACYVVDTARISAGTDDLTV